MAIEGEMPMEEMEPKDKLEHLRADELVIGARLTPGQYAELLLGHFIQRQPIQAKYCYMRAIQRFENDTALKQIWIVGQHVCNGNLALALNSCKGTVLEDHSLQPYINELGNRLLAEQLRIIANTYSSLESRKFSQMICSSGEQELSLLLKRCAWTIDEDAYIIPNWNQNFSQTLASMVDPKYGGHEGFQDERMNKVAQSETAGRKNLQELTSLVKSTIFFDAMATNSTQTINNSMSS